MKLYTSSGKEIPRGMEVVELYRGDVSATNSGVEVGLTNDYENYDLIIIKVRTDWNNLHNVVIPKGEYGSPYNITIIQASQSYQASGHVKLHDNTKCTITLIQNYTLSLNLCKVIGINFN